MQNKEIALEELGNTSLETMWERDISEFVEKYEEMLHAEEEEKEKAQLAVLQKRGSGTDSQRGTPAAAKKRGTAAKRKQKEPQDKNKVTKNTSGERKMHKK